VFFKHDNKDIGIQYVSQFELCLLILPEWKCRYIIKRIICIFFPLYLHTRKILCQNMLTSHTDTCCSTLQPLSLAKKYYSPITEPEGVSRFRKGPRSLEPILSHYDPLHTVVSQFLRFTLVISSQLWLCLLETAQRHSSRMCYLQSVHGRMGFEGYRW
jgi:hypothetical protein